MLQQRAVEKGHSSTMDGKFLLIGVVGIFGAIFLLSGTSFNLGNFNLPVLEQSLKPMAPNGGKPKGDPADPNSFLAGSNGNYTATGPIASTEHRTAAFVGKVLDRHNPNGSKQPPAEGEVLAARDRCSFSRPASGSRVAYIRASGHSMSTGVYATTSEDVTDAARKIIDTYKSIGDRYLQLRPGRYELDGFDVAVSDTDYPVHLVLEAETPTVWNVHMAPGARVTGVSILRGGTTSAIAGLPEDTRVEVIHTPVLDECRKSNSAFQARDNAELRRQADEAFDAGDYALYERLKARPKHLAYNNWFRSQFGVYHNDIKIGYRKAKVALVGPMPTGKESLVPFTPLESKAVRIFTTKRVHLMEESAFKEMFRDEAFAMADSVAGGSLSNINRGGN